MFTDVAIYSEAELILLVSEDEAVAVGLVAPPALRLAVGADVVLFAILFVEALLVEVEVDCLEGELVAALLTDAALLTLAFRGAEFTDLVKTEHNKDINKNGIRMNVKLT